MRQLPFEDQRNVDMQDVFEAMIKETYPDVKGVGCGHHIMYMREGHVMPYDYPSADALIFDHQVAQTIWGEAWQHTLTELALVPATARDALLRQLYAERERMR
jgi:hypothetical protein